jgi:hypothetical protein
MRIFSPIQGEDIVAKIAGEMFNIEAGKKIYDNGMVIAVNEQTAYPLFESKSGAVITTIRASRGLLILPCVVQDGAFISLITKTLEAMEKEYIRVNGVSHLDRSIVLETAMEHFTVLKCRPTLLTRHMICALSFDVMASIRYSERRFIWIMRPMIDYLRETFTDTLQLVGILYDAGQMLTIQNNEVMHEQLTLKHTKIGKQFHDVIYAGLVNDELIAKLNTVSATTQLMSDLRSLIDSYHIYKKDTHFMLSYQNGQMYLCPIRKAAFEIIRHLGNWELYNRLIIAPQLHKLTQPVSMIDYNKINIKDICTHCSTPLYDDIYVIQDENSEYIAYCPICIHSKWLNRMLDTTGTPLYKVNDIIYKTTYPRTAATIIEQLPVDIIVKDILLTLQKNQCTIDNCFVGRCLYIGSPVKYIAWSGAFADYINYTNIAHSPIKSIIEYANIFAFHTHIVM